MADIPNLPTLGRDVDPNIRRAFQALRIFFEAVRGEGGFSDGLSSTQVSSLIDSSLPGLTDQTIPPVPAGLTATGSFNQIILQWTAPSYLYHSYTQIWRASVDSFGSAVLVGTARGSVFADMPPDSDLSTTHYYWIRFVSEAGVVGPLNATAGTSASLADDPDYLLQIATVKWQASYNYSVGDLVIPTTPNGYCYEVTVDGGSSGGSEPTWPTTLNETVSDGGLTWKCAAAFSFESFFQVALVDGVPRLTLKELFLADGIIKRVMIEDAAIDNAKIANVSADKLLAGVIAAGDIFVGPSNQIEIDGINERIVVSDGTYDRVILGNLGTGWGIEVRNELGQTILNSGGVSWNYITGRPADALLLNELGGIGGYQETQLPYVDKPCCIDCFINNASAANYWFKVAEFTLDGANESCCFDGLFSHGASSGRFDKQMRVQVNVSTSSAAGSIASAQYKYSGPDITDHFRVFYNPATAVVTFYAHLYAWDSCLFNGAWTAKCTQSQTWIHSEQGSADNIGTSTPSGTEIVATANYELGADSTANNPQSPSWLTSPVVWIGNKIDVNNISTYMSSAAITEAYIGTAVVDTLHVKANAIADIVGASDWSQHLVENNHNWLSLGIQCVLVVDAYDLSEGPIPVVIDVFGEAGLSNQMSYDAYAKTRVDRTFNGATINVLPEINVTIGKRTLATSGIITTYYLALSYPSGSAKIIDTISTPGTYIYKQLWRHYMPYPDGGPRRMYVNKQGLVITGTKR